MAATKVRIGLFSNTTGQAWTEVLPANKVKAYRQQAAMQNVILTSSKIVKA